MNSRTTRELRRISESIPKELTDALMVEQDAIPTIKLIVAKALKSKKTPKALKEKLQAALDAGEFDMTETVEDAAVAKKIEEYFDEEIKKGIESGRITIPKDDKFFNRLMKKAKQYARRNSRENALGRSKGEHAGENSDRLLQVPEDGGQEGGRGNGVEDQTA